MNDIMGSLRYGNPHQQQQYEKEQQERAMQDDRYRNQTPAPAPTPQSPIGTAVELLDLRINQLQEVTGRLFLSLKPVTTKTVDNYPVETRVSIEGNSPLTIELNATADRIESITAALKSQIDGLEV